MMGDCIPTHSAKTFVVVAVGCRTNQYEAEAFKNQLEGLGYISVEEGEKADLCLIHTCAVTENAEGSSRHAIRSMISRHPGSRVIVTGCLAKKEAGQMASIEGVTDVITCEEKETIIQRLFPESSVRPFAISRFDGHTRAFVKVQDGCNHFCAYCTVPYLRGRSRSRPIDQILDEVHDLVRSGYKEIVLTGVNIGDYVDGEKTLADLVRQVDDIQGVQRLRISSINPNEVDDRLLDAIASGRSTCTSMHLVLQSGSNAILKDMRRLYTRELYLEKVSRFKDRCPDFTFTTDIIVGFPGETNDDFLDTLDIIQRVHFAKVHMFPYSERPQTRAERYPNKVSQDVIKERKALVLELAQNEAFALRQLYVGKAMEVLTETRDDNGFVQGLTKNGLPVLMSDEFLKPNTFVNVSLQKNTSCGFIGTVLEAIS
jgi:threonylcarbamoyladenosine tRNA methylthiotransferase MtaB